MGKKKAGNNGFRDQKEGKQDAELLLFRLVMEYRHAQKSSDDPEKGKEEKGILFDTPFLFPRLVFVEAVEEEREDVQEDVEDEDIRHVSIINGFLFFLKSSSIIEVWKTEN